MGGGLLSLSLSLSLSLALVARLCVKFKRLFYSFHRNFILSCRNFFLFHRSFNSSFCLQKAFFRALCFFEIFKRFIFGLFALIIASRFCENGVAIHKFSVIFTLWIATLALLARNDGLFCHFEPFAKRRKIHIVILSVSEISTEFKTHFKFKVKNPRFKGAISTLNLWILRFLTKAQYDKGKINRQNKAI